MKENKTKLVIFDFDYTLAETNEKIWLWSPRGTRSHQNKPYIPVHPSVISKIPIGDDEYIDNNSYVEFYGVNIDSTRPIKLLLNLLDYYTIKNESIIWILTARPEEAKDDIFKFLNNHSIRIQNIKYYGLQNSVPQSKITFIKDTAPSYIDHIIIYEDNKYIIDNIKQYFNIKINTHYVEHINNKIMLHIDNT